MNLGLVFQSGDAVLIGVFVCLILMSVTTWFLIAMRTIKYIVAKKANQHAIKAIWQAHNLEEVEAISKKIHSPISELTQDGITAKQNFEIEKHNLLSASLPFNAYLERELRHSMGKIMNRFETGLTIMATVGSTAPFIGLLGTVWGIYHALINISHSGQMSIAAVSGPIGEALVSTAIGLFVAIPAVLAYNCFMRSNKNLLRQLHNFAHDFHVQLINNKEKES